MRKLKIGDLKKLQEKVKRTANIRKGKARAVITIHMGTCGIAAGARDIMSVFLKEIEKKRLKDVIILTSGCAGLCSQEPMITIQIKDQPPVKYVNLNDTKTKMIFKDHIIQGKIVEKFALALGSERTV